MSGILKRPLFFFLIFVSIFYLLLRQQQASLSSIFSFIANADTLTVSISVGQTTLTFSGKTTPNAQITFMESGAVIGTTQADSNGNFSKSLVYFEQGVRTVNIYFTDSENRTSSTISYTVFLQLGLDTSVGNIVLPPTIALDATEITKGDTLTLLGEAVPSSTITLFFSDNTSVGTTAGTSGSWQYEYNTSSLSAGNYTVYTKASTGGGYQSEVSETKSFTITAAVLTPTPTPIITPTPGPANTPAPGQTNTPGPAATSTPIPPTPTPKPKPKLLPSLISQLFDFNQSGRIELTEVYDVVKKWAVNWRSYLAIIRGGQKAGKEKYETCDLNHDGVCNLVDFSVLMYYVNR